MAEAYAQAIRLVKAPGACVIGGISFGGLVAFETARRLAAAGESVEHVVLLDARPGARSLTAPDYWRFRMMQPFRILRYVVPDLRTRVPDVIRRTLPWLPAWLRSGRRSSDPRATETSQWLKIADQAGQAYRPGRYEGSVTLFVTRKPPLSTFDPETVWSRRVDGDFAIQPIPGGHLDFLRGPRLGIVAAELSRVLGAS
jgi:thioesterase domain-containing protein